MGGTTTGMPPAGLELTSGADQVLLDFDGAWAYPTPVTSGLACTGTHVCIAGGCVSSIEARG